jgi:RTX calcium-binding nonapeptide repeat (4 copies)
MREFVPRPAIGAALTTLILACGVFMLAPGAALAGTLDQQQTDYAGTTANIQSTSSFAQTFTAGLSGGLDQVDLYLGSFGAPGVPLYVDIRPVSGGVPGNTILASQLVPASGIPAAGTFVPINFAAPAPIVAGTPYAIVAYSSVTGGKIYTWGASTNANAYPAGGPFLDTASPPDGNWSSPPVVTALAFRTYVVTGPPGGATSCGGKPITISGTNGADKLSGTPGTDVIAALGGNDKVSGLAGNDTICGGAGKDTLKGGKGNDKLLGEAGKDTLKGGPGKDKLKGGAGKDKQVQ